MELRYINRTDLIIAGICILFLLIFLVNIALGSAILLYLADIIALGTFIYWGIRKDSTRMLIRSLIIGGIVAFLYTFLDTLLVEVSITTYLRKNEDFCILSTPLSVVLYWAFFVTTIMYLYQRLRSSFSKFYIPSLLTGLVSFIFGVALLYLGDLSRQWVWSVGDQLKPMQSIGPVPLYVPIAFFVTFFLSPYIIGVKNPSILKDDENAAIRYFKISDNPLVGGIRCTIILSASLYGLLQLFMRIQLYR